MEQLGVVDSIIVLHGSELYRSLSIGCHVVQSFFFTCFTVILVCCWSLWWILVEYLMLMNYLVVVMIVHIHRLMSLAPLWMLLLCLSWLFNFDFFLHLLDVLLLFLFLLLLLSFFVLWSLTFLLAFLCFEKKTVWCLLLSALFFETTCS